ncbi:hypothetical protein K445DRAFT_320495 [Daldinia sp. EC12]|nr:hypothetical protein K445DRAFT_320495 [Daldinia sp. EC12]
MVARILQGCAALPPPAPLQKRGHTVRYGVSALCSVATANATELEPRAPIRLSRLMTAASFLSDWASRMGASAAGYEAFCEYMRNRPSIRSTRLCDVRVWGERRQSVITSYRVT